MEGSHEITELLGRAAEGQDGALDEVLERVYDDLERLAEKHMRRRFGPGAEALTLEPAALVNEMFLKLVQQRNRYVNRAQFFAIATKLMLRALVDYRRARDADKRGGGQFRVTLTGIAAVDPSGPDVEPMALVEALARLEELDARKAEVVKLRALWGFEVAEISGILGVSEPTVKRDWRFARSWLASELKGSS